MSLRVRGLDSLGHSLPLLTVIVQVVDLHLELLVAPVHGVQVAVLTVRQDLESHLDVSESL